MAAPKPLTSSVDIISRSWENFRKHLREYAEFAVLIVLLSILQWTLGVLLRSIIDDAFLLLTTTVIASLPIVIATAVVAGGMIDFTTKAIQKKKVDVRSSLLAGVHHLLSFIWISILVSFAVLFGFILFIIPAFLFYVWFRFANYHLFAENVRGRAALSESKDLVSGKWWAVFWRILVPTVFFAMATYFITAVLYLVVGAVLGDPRLFFSNINDVDQLSNTHTLVTAVVPELVNGLAFALFLGADVVLWLDLKRKRS